MGAQGKRRLLLTGASGKIGCQIRHRLAKQYDWVLTDKNVPSVLARDNADDPPFYQADIADITALRPLCQGIDTVVHCAAASQIIATWEELLPNNLIGSYNILQAAAEANCRRVIFVSSVHTVYGYVVEQPVQPEWPVYPISLYGASKVWGEAVAALFAQQSTLSVICLRLGAVKYTDELRPGHTNLAEVITTDDLMRLFVAAIEAPDTLQYGCFHGLSNNRYKRLDISETEKILGYAPQDDAFAIAQRNQRSWRWWGARFVGKISRLMR